MLSLASLLADVNSDMLRMNELERRQPLATRRRPIKSHVKDTLDFAIQSLL